MTDPKVEAFIQDVLDEVIELFPSKLLHIGGMRPTTPTGRTIPVSCGSWKRTTSPPFPTYRFYSINRFSNYLASKGVKMMGWNEITGDNIRGEAHIEASQTEQLAKGTIVHFWDGDISLVNKAIDKGYDVVNSNRHFTYLDYPYEVTPLEKAYSFSPIPEGLERRKSPRCLAWAARCGVNTRPTSPASTTKRFPASLPSRSAGGQEPRIKITTGFGSG